MTQFEADLSGLDGDAWLGRLEDITEEFGRFEPLGPDHSSAYLEGGDQLLVSFESRTDIARTQKREPLGVTYRRRNGWSTLTILSDRQSWFRHRAIFEHFDRLADDGFFELFDTVTFFGEGACGYAAAAYSAAAPGATVVAIRPHATLDPRIAGWDDRFRRHRRTGFSGRYGYAPDLIEAAGHAFIAFDPHQRRDAMHAALFIRPNVTLLRCPFNRLRVREDLEGMGLLDPLLEAAIAGRLTERAFWEFYRRRRTHLPYLRGLVILLERRGRGDLAARVCRFAMKELPHPFFVRRLAKRQTTRPL